MEPDLDVQLTVDVLPCLPANTILMTDSQGTLVTSSVSSISNQSVTWSDIDLESLADRLVPVVLRKMAHPEARSIAEAAISAASSSKEDRPTVDRVALWALADWLEERLYDDLAGKVRQLIPRDGSLLLVTLPDDAPSHLFTNARSRMEKIQQDLLELFDITVHVLVLSNSMSVRLMDLSNKKGD